VCQAPLLAPIAVRDSSGYTLYKPKSCFVLLLLWSLFNFLNAVEGLLNSIASSPPPPLPSQSSSTTVHAWHHPNTLTHSHHHHRHLACFVLSFCARVFFHASFSLLSLRAVVERLLLSLLLLLLHTLYTILFSSLWLTTMRANACWPSTPQYDSLF
jgi:hypothetical protein